MQDSTARGGQKVATAEAASFKTAATAEHGLSTKDLAAFPSISPAAILIGQQAGPRWDRFASPDSPISSRILSSLALC